MQHTTFQLAELNEYHRNARRGNVEAIADSLRVNGQYKPIVVNAGTHTGRPNEVIVGNHTLAAAQQLGWESISAVVVDVDEDHARRIVLADNRTSDLGGYDDEMLLGLLMDSEDFDGTAYTMQDVEALQAFTYTADDGPRDLDALHSEVGDPTPDDALVTVRLQLPPELAQRLTDRLGEDHAAAVAQLLDDDPVGTSGN